ncbi:retrovirus-related pol polyprotein from transposon TNT 1-94 [Tanacetum coccineum]
MTYPCLWFSEQVRLAGDMGSTNDVMIPLNQECNVLEVKALDASSVYMESSRTISGKQNESSSLGNECSRTWNENSRAWNESNADGADIRPSNDKEPMVEISDPPMTKNQWLRYQTPLNIMCWLLKNNIPSNLNSSMTHMWWKKDDSNINHDSAYMNPCEGEVDWDTKKNDKEHALLALLIKNLKLDIDESKKINKYLKKVNAVLTLKLTKYKHFQTNHKAKEETKLKCAKAFALLTKTNQKCERSLKLQGLEGYGVTGYGVMPKHFKTLSLDELRSPDFNLFSDQEYSEEEVAETMAETMEQYMSKTRADYGSGVARPKIEDKDNFELKGQFLKELRTNTFSGSDHEDANEHIEKVLEIVDLFHIPNITIDQVMLRAFPMSLTGAASRWLRNKPTGSITTWDGLKTKFLNKYCPPARTAKKMEEINNF